MKTEKIQKLYKEYQSKFDKIIDDYGEKDGFVIDGKYWWDEYRNKIEKLVKLSESNSLTEEEAQAFYKSFGFGPKLYGITFIEEGIEKLQKVFLFLADRSISPDGKIRALVEEPESEHFVRGIGINFVTLFLTSLFPNEYVQWNLQTDGALKLLDLYPKKEKGEKKSSFYLKINSVCKELSKTLSTDLPHIDNILYCLNRGYIGEEIQIEREEEKPQQSQVIDEITAPTSTAEKSTHTEMIYYLVKIGLNKGYDVWVATNDKNKIFDGENLSDLCLREIPNFTRPETLGIAKYIDVIWFKGNTSYPVRFFEVEHSTSIYSGLLRLNDVKIDYPLGKATIVIPKSRLDLFETQIERRTFKYSELSDVCDSLTYEDLKEWFKAVDVDSRYS